MLPADAVFIILGCVLLIVGIFIGYAAGQKIGALRSGYAFEKKVPDIRKDAIVKSRAVLGGQFSEQLAPYLPNFPFTPTEVRFIGKPIDFIVFRGIDQKNIEEVIFVEVKSGSAQLNPAEKSLKAAILAKKVSWEEYRPPLR